MGNDNYLTIRSPSQGIYKEKGSRFLANAFPVTSLDEIKQILNKTRKENNEARHHCYAYIIGFDRSTWRLNDDGEPSGTAGRPILGQINSSGLTNILIVVSRYFGGTLLGVSGLINAYKSAASAAIENSDIIENYLNVTYEITFPYVAMNSVMKIIKDEEIRQSDHSFDIICRVRISFRVSESEKIMKRFDRIEGMKYMYIDTR